MNQPASPLKTDNSTTADLISSGMKPKCSKTREMRIHWLRNKYILSNRSEFFVTRVTKTMNAH